MIIELGRIIAHICRSIHHFFFRALFCKDWTWLRHYGAMCRRKSRPYTLITYCTYEECPKRKGVTNENRR